MSFSRSKYFQEFVTLTTPQIMSQKDLRKLLYEQRPNRVSMFTVVFALIPRTDTNRGVTIKFI